MAKTTVSMLLSSIKNRELDKRGKLSKEGTPADDLESASALSDEEIIETVSTEIKKRKEAIATFEDAGRAEMAENEKKEMDVLRKYLPEQMSEEDVKTLIADAISETGASSPADMGKVMGVVSQKTKGRFDGKQLASFVTDALKG